MSTATPDRDRFGPDELAAVLGALLPQWPRSSLLVGLSGGPDSAALLWVLAALAARWPTLAVRALHVDHGLQAAAGALAGAARRQALQAGVVFDVLAVQVAAGRHGVEAAAREARYAALGAALQPGEALLTAHHEDDQAETVLLQLLRGAGVSGAAAMPRSAPLGHGLHLRPCLGFRRAALARVASAAGLPTVADPMNADPRYERAYLRARLAPSLNARWPAWTTTLSRAARHFAAAQSVLDEVACADIAKACHGDALKVDVLRELSVERQALALRHWLRGRDVVVPNTRRLDALRAMLTAGPACCPQVCWPGVVVFRHDGCLHAQPPTPAWPPAAIALDAAQPVVVPGLGRFEVLACATGPARLAEGALTLRPRAGGERLKRRADGPRRPVKDLLREARVPALLRDSVPFLWRDGAFAGVLTPGGAWLDSDALAAPGAPGVQVRWSQAPAALRAAFIEAPRPLP